MMTEQERREKRNLIDMLEGELTRIRITDDLYELDNMTLYAIKNICKLSEMRAREIKLAVWAKRKEE